MLKRYLFLLLLCSLCVTSYAQYLTPTQLKKIHSLWVDSSPEELENYLTQQSKYWQSDASMMEIDPKSRSITWVYNSPTAPVCLLMVMTQNDGKSIIDKTAFITDSKRYYESYESAIKSSGATFVNSKTQNGSRLSFYKSNSLLYILTIDPPNEKGVVLYSIIIQS